MVSFLSGQVPGETEAQLGKQAGSRNRLSKELCITGRSNSGEVTKELAKWKE